jgi:hypothetical protein
MINAKQHSEAAGKEFAARLMRSVWSIVMDGFAVYGGCWLGYPSPEFLYRDKDRTAGTAG